MANILYGAARAAFLQGTLNMSSTIKAVLLDLEYYGLAVTGATNATPIVITTATHGLTTGDEVTITGVGGNDAANNTAYIPAYHVTVLSTTTFSLQDPATGDDISGDGNWTSGGHVIKISLDDNLNDVPSGARVGTPQTLTSKTYANGIFDAAPVTFPSVPSGDPCEAILVYLDTGIESTSKLIAFISQSSGLPFTPSGGDITVTWGSGYYRIFRL